MDIKFFKLEEKSNFKIYFLSYFTTTFTLQSPSRSNEIENINTPTESKYLILILALEIPDNPPTAPKITANGAVHAGQPGVSCSK